MRIIIKNLILLIFVLSIIGCNSNSSEDINNDTKVLVIDSNISTGTTIGKVDIPQRDNDEIEDIYLIGNGSDNFTISENGEIKSTNRLSSINKSFLRVEKREVVYYLQVVTIYQSGYKFIINIEIKVYIYENSNNETTEDNNTISTQTESSNELNDTISTQAESGDDESNDTISTQVESSDDESNDIIATQIESSNDESNNTIATQTESSSESDDTISSEIENSEDESNNTIVTQTESSSESNDTISSEIESSSEVNNTNTQINHIPISLSQAITTNENTSVSITLTAEDIDDDNLTYIVTSQPSYGLLDGIAPNLTYTPNINYYGTDKFSFKVNDGKVDSNISDINITINSVTQNSSSTTSSQTTSTTTTTTKEATLYDSIVIGARYDAGNGITGYTDSNGVFRYIEGQNVKFYINDIFIGEGQPINKPIGVSVTTDKIITPLELADAGDDIDNPKVLKIVQFLISLDNDLNPNNGLDINQTKVSSFNINLLDDNIDIHTTFGTALTPPSTIEAREHLCQSLNRLNCIGYREDIAHLFGVATQGTDSSYSYYQPASYAIDNNDSTYNHTRGGANDENWLQIKLPNPTKIYKIIIQSRNSNTYRLEGAKVYITNQEYNGTVDESSAIYTLQGIANEQIITLETPISGNYLLIKGKHDDSDNSHIHLIKAEVYGEIPVIEDYIVQFPKQNYNFGLEVNKPVGTIIGRVSALNYAQKSLTYSIVGDVPFSIDNSGEIKLTSTINHNQVQSYNFQVKVDDGNNTNTTNVTVSLLSINGIKQERWDNISGTLVSDLLNSSHYQNDIPDETQIVDDLDMPRSSGDSFGQKMSGILKPLVSGDYIFAIIGDDGTQLNLNGEMIAYKSGWGSYQDWNSAGVSKEIYLNAGEIYSIEAFLKEGAGAEHISVGWKQAGEDNFEVIPANELFVEKLDSENIKPQINPHDTLYEIKSANAIGDIVATISAFDSQGDSLSYSIVGDVPFSIDNSGNITINNSLEIKTYSFEVEVSDGVSTIRTTVNIKSDTDTHALNSTKDDFELKAEAFTSDSDLDELINSYLNYAHEKAKDTYFNFMQTTLDSDTWDWIANDNYIKEGLYASRFPANPYVIKNLTDFKYKFTQDGNASFVDEYKNIILGLAVNAKERGIDQEAVFGDTNEHRTIDYAKLANYEEKEKIWREEHVIQDLGYGIDYYDFKNYLQNKYDLSVSEADSLWSTTTVLKTMANNGEDILSADYNSRKQYGLSFDGFNLYRLSNGLSRLNCYDTDNPCQKIQEWIDDNGTITKSQFLADFKTYKNKVELINPLDNMADELSELLGVAPDKYRLMSFYDFAKWKISLDNIAPIDFGDDEPNWPIFNASLKYNTTNNAYPWQLMALEQSAQKQECGYVKSRFFETDKSKLIDSYPPNAVDGGAKEERRFIEYTNYTWAYNEPDVWFRESEWSPHRTVYRILQDGGVCGRQSTMGQHVNECLNRPSIGVGQPGHRAWVGVYNHPTIANQYYIKIGYQVGSKESASSGINSIYDRYTLGIRDRGIERFGGVATGVSQAGVGEHIFNQSMILQHIGKILETEGKSPETILRKAIDIAPTNVDAWYQLARYYANQDEPEKAVDLAIEFMNKRDTFFLDDDSQKGGENLEVITGKVIAFISLEAPSIQDGKGENAQTLKDRLWSYLDTYEADYRSYRTYGYQNRYLAQLYLVGQDNKDGFINEIESLFSRFLQNSTSGWYANNYFENVYWGDINKTALFDSLQELTDQAQISDSMRNTIYEKILERTQGTELATVIVNDSCSDDNLSKCQSLKSFELDAQAVYIITSNNAVGEDSEVDPTKQGEEGYSTLVIPVVDDQGKEMDIEVKIAKVATVNGIEGKLLKINDPTAVETEKTEIIAWIDKDDNQLEPNRIYTAKYRIVLNVKKRVTNNEEYMGDIIINIQDLMLGENSIMTSQSWNSQTFEDDTTSIYFVTLNEEIGATTGVWANSGYNLLNIKVEDENGVENIMKLRATNDSSWTMNSGLNADWDNTLKLEYYSGDNNLTSGVRYKTISPVAIDARMWHKSGALLKRLYLEIDTTIP